jgi:hypothetical protein
MKAEIIAMDDGAVTIAVDGIIVHLVDVGDDEWTIVMQDDIVGHTSYGVVSHKDGLSRLVAALLDYSDARKETDMG